jgi:hypothetical protein
LSFLAVIASRWGSNRIKFICISVTIACLLAPVNQARIDTLTSLHKHVVFGAWFAAIAAGYVINQAGKLQLERSWRTAISWAVVVPLMLSAFSLSGELYQWAPSSGLVAKMEPLLHNDGSHYLVDPESANILYYYLHTEIYPGELSLVQCSWWDPDLGRELHGPSACSAAVNAGYYDLIETDDAANGPAGTAAENAVWRAIRSSGNYRLIYRARQRYHPADFFEIWQLINPPGVPNDAGS